VPKPVRLVGGFLDGDARVGGRRVSVNRVLKVPNDEQPTAKHTSVTLKSPRRSSAIARSMRLVIRYEYGDSP
jgi:hypothetical protein